MHLRPPHWLLNQLLAGLSVGSGQEVLGALVLLSSCVRPTLVQLLDRL